MPDDARQQPDRRAIGQRPDGGRRATDPIQKLETHKAAFVEIGQLADYWGLHEGTVLYYVRRQKLRAYRFGKTFRIRREDALHFEQSCLFRKRTAS